MKAKIFLFVVSLLTCFNSFSQITITFNVDVQSLPVAPGGVHIAGQFVSTNAISIQEEWQPAAPGSLMALIYGTTYSVDITFPSASAGDSLQFEFVRDSAWWGILGDASEGNNGDCCLNTSCAVEFFPGAFNRLIMIPDCGGTYNCVFNQCSAIIPSSCDTLHFACSSPNVCEKFCIDFFDSTNNNAISWHWIFAGGNPSSSTLQNPANVCYENPGVYDVTLITTSAYGIDTFYKPNYVTVNPTPAFPAITQTGYTLTSSAADFYQWQFNTVDIPGATNQVYNVLQTGYYTVVIGDTNGCVNSAMVYVLIDGISDVVGDSNFSVFPNPFSVSTTISFYLPRSENVSLKIFDVQGRLIRTLTNELMSASSHQVTWDARDENGKAVAAAIYFLKLETENQCETILLNAVK